MSDLVIGPPVVDLKRSTEARNWDAVAWLDENEEQSLTIWLPARKPVNVMDRLTYERHSVRYVTAINERSPERETPRVLVATFALGLLLFAVGAVLVAISFIIPNKTNGLVSSALFAVGSTVVVLSLLRGRDLEARSKR